VTVPDNLYVRTLVRAANIVGGEAELALRLNIKPNVLHLWIIGNVTPPLDVFLKAVDIVVQHDQHITAPWLPRAEGPSPDAGD
jgi:hypothetical protein